MKKTKVLSICDTGEYTVARVHAVTVCNSTAYTVNW